MWYIGECDASRNTLAIALRPASVRSVISAAYTTLYAVQNPTTPKNVNLRVLARRSSATLLKISVTSMNRRLSFHLWVESERDEEYRA